MSKNWKPADLRGTAHLLCEHRAIEEERIAANAAAGSWLPYKPGWTSAGDLNPYRPAPDEFETPDDRHYLPGPAARDYSDASEGAGQVTIRASDYDIAEPEVFSPHDATVKYGLEGGWKYKRRATADEEQTLGFDFDADLAGKMAVAVQAWAGMTTPPPKAADPTVETLVLTYLASGGEVHTFDDYQTTPRSKIKFKLKGSSRPEWAGRTGIPPELRRTKKLFRARPKTGSKFFSHT